MLQSDSTSSIMPQVIISAQKLTQSIQLQQKLLTIFENIDVEILAGEQVAITGRSGSGKSTLLGILATLDQASSGQLYVSGESVHDLNEEQRALIRLKHIGFVFQSFQLLPSLTALENVMLPLRLQPHFNYADAEKKAESLLKRVGLERQIHQTPKVLSGGEQQRVAIARSIANAPKVLIADEPTGNLDPENSWEIMNLLEKINIQGTTILMATHNSQIVNTLRHRVIAIENGRIVRDQIEGEYGYDD